MKKKKKSEPMVVVPRSLLHELMLNSTRCGELQLRNGICADSVVRVYLMPAARALELLLRGKRS